MTISDLARPLPTGLTPHTPWCPGDCETAEHATGVEVQHYGVLFEVAGHEVWMFRGDTLGDDAGEVHTEHAIGLDRPGSHVLPDVILSARDAARLGAALIRAARLMRADQQAKPGG